VNEVRSQKDDVGIFQKCIQHLSVMVLRYRPGIDLPIIPELYSRRENATHNGSGWRQFQKEFNDFIPVHPE
jgi:hypothetical protein